MGVCFAALQAKREARLGWAVLPYALLAALCLFYYVRVQRSDPLLAIIDDPPVTDWEWQRSWGWHRIPNFLVYVFASTMRDWAFFPAALLMLAAPWLLRARLNTEDKAALVPIVVVMVTWLAAPAEALKTAYLYHRFALFLLPAYAMAFRPREDAGAPAGASRTRVMAMAVGAALAIVCWSFIGTLIVRERRFAAESAPFETLLAAAEPGQRALTLVYTPESEAIRHPWAYHVYPMWYQAERHGFVDFNFACFLPQIVRFRPEHLPALRPGPGFLGTPKVFDWHRLDARIYRYFFVRHKDPLPAGMFDNDQCEVVLVKESGDWSLYERRTCR
jgi:hypothetical protein